MKSSAITMEGLRAKTIRQIRKSITAYRVLASVSVLVTILVYVAVVIPPFPWLPGNEKTESLLGTLLTAQAAITALTLAVTLFVVQGASNKRNSDDRMYREYIRRSWARIIFRGSIVAVGFTGAALLAESFFGTVSPPAFTPGLRNLLLATLPALIANLGLAALLFERMIRLSQPDNWQTIRLAVNQRDIREAIQIYVNRLRHPESEANSSIASFPQSVEGSASEAIRSLLDDCREAMTERRYGDFNRILTSMENLIAHAMDELSAAGFKWNPPGTQPQWPPMRELYGNLNSFREEIILGKDRDFLSRLLTFDYWILCQSIQQRRGELFTVALANDRQNYEIAKRVDIEDLHGMLSGRILLNAPVLLSDMVSEEKYPYFQLLVAHQERRLNGAVQSDSPTEYRRLHEEFEEFIRVTEIFMNSKQGYQPTAIDQIRRLEQDYRLALMGLGGRAALLAGSGEIADANPYLDVVRGKHSRVEILADDIARAMTIANYDSKGFTLWDEWDMEQAKSFEGYWSYPERYPLTWFAVRLIELSAGSQQGLNLHGKAKQIKDWFERNAEGLESAVQDSPGQSVEERRELATAALKTAVDTDDTAQDYDIISRDLSQGRLSAFNASANETASTTDYIGKLFERAGAFCHLPFDADERPETKVIRDWQPKAYLAEWPENYPIHFVPLDGSPWGQAYSDSLVKILGEALEDAPHISIHLDTPLELLEAIDTASEALNPTDELIVVLVGDWSSIVIGLSAEGLDGYEPMWRVPEEERIGNIGLYGGSPIVGIFNSDERLLYVIDAATWGELVKAEVEPENYLDIKVNPVSDEVARKYLKLNPKLFDEQPDIGSRLRKIQTLVEIILSHRSGFLVRDSSRARRITGL